MSSESEIEKTHETLQKTFIKAASAFGLISDNEITALRLAKVAERILGLTEWTEERIREFKKTTSYEPYDAKAMWRDPDAFEPFVDSYEFELDEAIPVLKAAVATGVAARVHMFSALHTGSTEYVDGFKRAAAGFYEQAAFLFRQEDKVRNKAVEDLLGASDKLAGETSKDAPTPRDFLSKELRLFNESSGGKPEYGQMLKNLIGMMDTSVALVPAEVKKKPSQLTL